MHKALKASIGAVLVAGLTAGTWFTAQSVQSPEQRRQAVAPPPLSRVTAPVEQGRIEDRIQLTCEAGFTAVRTLDLPGEAHVATRIPARQGDIVRSGMLVADLQGQPVIALTGTFPFYRDIDAESAGPDVDQLRTGLALLGYLVVSGTETGTAAGRPLLQATAALVRDLGYPAGGIRDKVPASLFVVVPKEGGTLVSIQSEPGPAQKPFAQLGLGGKRWLCTGKDGGVPVGIEAGQSARILTEQSPNASLRVSLEQVSKGAQAGAGSLGSGSQGSASQGGGAQAGGEGSSPGASQGSAGASADQAARVVVLPRAAASKETQAKAEVTVKAGPPNSLIVPASALWMKDGKTLVTVVEGDAGSSDAPTRDVEVTPGMAVAGRTVVVPASGERLAAGNAVVVGQSQTRGGT